MNRNNSPEGFLNTMRQIAREAGDISRDMIQDSRPDLKADKSVITRADRAVSELVHNELAEYLQTPQHILIEEEDPQKGEYLNQELLERTPYIWAIDPIDGTRLYANGIPLYAVSLGLLKDRRPWLGLVYFPLLDELFYCDGQDAFYVRDAFSDKERVRQILPQDQEITSRSLFLLSDHFFRENRWDDRDCRLIITACAAVNLCWPSIGRGIGSLDQSSLWDFAGSWPVVRAAGLQLRHWQTGEVLDQVNTAKFQTGNKVWRLKDYHILCRKDHFDPLKARMIKG